MVFLARWNTPFAHKNHSVLHYSLEVLNNHDKVKHNILACLSPCGSQNISFTAPNQTQVCDMLMLTLTAVNDIGSSNSTVANITIPIGM